jgi:hypothetical protein
MTWDNLLSGAVGAVGAAALTLLVTLLELKKQTKAANRHKGLEFYQDFAREYDQWMKARETPDGEEGQASKSAAVSLRAAFTMGLPDRQFWEDSIRRAEEVGLLEEAVDGCIKWICEDRYPTEDAVELLSEHWARVHRRRPWISDQPKAAVGLLSEIAVSRKLFGRVVCCLKVHRAPRRARWSFCHSCRRNRPNPGIEKGKVLPVVAAETASERK